MGGVGETILVWKGHGGMGDVDKTSFDTFSWKGHGI